jgi:hypothetical protein
MSEAFFSDRAAMAAALDAAGYTYRVEPTERPLPGVWLHVEPAGDIPNGRVWAHHEDEGLRLVVSLLELWPDDELEKEG